MDDFSRLDFFYRAQESFEQGTIVLHPVSRDMNYDEAEAQGLEIMFVLEALVDGDEHVAVSLDLQNQLGIGQSAPVGFCHTRHLVVGKSLLQAWIHTLI